MVKFLAEPDVLAAFGNIGRTSFDTKYIQTGRTNWVHLGPRIKRLPDTEVERLIAEDIAAAADGTGPKGLGIVRKSKSAKQPPKTKPARTTAPRVRPTKAAGG
jgi:hypothetical protein